MKSLKKQLSREEMKNVLGGSIKTLWDCYFSPTEYAGPVCSLTNPAVACDLYSCTNTGVGCSEALICY